MAAFLFSANASAQQSAYAALDSVDALINKTRYIHARDYSIKLADKYLKQKDFLNFSKASLKKADVYAALNDNEKVLKVLFDALNIVQKNQEKVGEIILARRIGAAYTSLQDLQKAKHYYYNALSCAKKIKNDSLIEALNQPLYKVHALSDSDSTLFYLKRTMVYSKKVGTPEALATVYKNYFAYYYAKEQFNLAKAYIDSAEQSVRKTSSEKKLKQILVNRAGYFYKINDFKNAEKTYRQVFELDKNDTLSMEASNYYYTYADILAKLGQFEKAYLYTEKAIAIRDSNYSAEVTSAVRDVETKYKIDKIEEERLADKLDYDERQSRAKKILFIIIAVFILTLILLYFFYQNNRLKQKNKLREIESEIQQNILIATIDGQETERKKIASVLHDNISAMLSSAGLQLTAFASGQGTPPDEIVKTRKILKEAHDKVRDLSHELVPTLLAKFGLAYALQDLCEQNSSKVISFEYVDDGNIKRYDEDFEMKIYFIASELLNNVLKHSKARHATLSLSANDGLSITVEDDGQGFNTAKPFSGEGFGLTQIRARISALGGQFSINSKPGSGTIVHFAVPVVSA